MADAYQGPPVQYVCPAASREDYVAGLMDEALAVAEDRSAVLLRFVEGMDPAETAELRRMLAAAKSRKSPR